MHQALTEGWSRDVLGVRKRTIELLEVDPAASAEAELVG